MVELSEKIVEILQSGNVLWLAVLLIVAFIMNASKILDFIEGRKKKQIKRLQEAASCQFLYENFKDFVSHELQREYFLYVANIGGEKPYRDKLFEIHKNSDGRLPFAAFRRASYFLKFDDQRVTIKIDLFDKLTNWFNKAAVIFFLFIGWAFFMMPILSKPITIVQAFSFIGAGLIFTFIAILFASQTFPLSSARKVQREIERQENQKNFNS